MATATLTRREKPISVDIEETDSDVCPFRWTVEDFYRAIEAKVFKHPERLELIQGEIFEKMSPQATPHAQGIVRSRKRLAPVFEPACHVRTQMPLNIGRTSEPEPDVMVVKGEEEDYDFQKPTPADVLLIIEVSDTTIRYDRGRKAALYAEAGIEDYWTLSLKGRWLEVRRDAVPTPNEKYAYSYKSVVRYSEEEQVTPLHAPNARIQVKDLLPRPPAEKAAADNSNEEEA